MSSAAGGRITAGVGSNLIGQHARDRNQDATVYVGNLDAQVEEEMVWEVFVQAGPVVNIYLPKDRITNNHQGYGFVEFQSEEDADYAIKILNMIKIFGKPIRVNKASPDKKVQEVGAKLFIGNLDPDVDEKLLYDTFSAFGVIIDTPQIVRDPESGVSKGYGFLNYDSFEAADAAMEAMNTQYLMNRQIRVDYAFKKDGSRGERHGDPAERALALARREHLNQQNRPHMLFATRPRGAPEAGPPPTRLGAAGPPPGMPAPPPESSPAMPVPVPPAPPQPGAFPPYPSMPSLPPGGMHGGPARPAFPPLPPGVPLGGPGNGPPVFATPGLPPGMPPPPSLPPIGMPPRGMPPPSAVPPPYHPSSFPPRPDWPGDPSLAPPPRPGMQPPMPPFPPFPGRAPPPVMPPPPR